jgi:salicylate hydroxylase
MPFKIVIVGTGIAGLSAAIALAGKGHHVTVVEATSKLQAIGGIIIIQANANRVLDGLGIYESLLTICGTAPLSLGARRYSDGEFLFTQPAGAHGDEYGYP